MSETVQWIITAAAVAAAAIFLVWRFVSRRKGCPYADRCGACQVDCRLTDECPEVRGSETEPPSNPELPES